MAYDRETVLKRHERLVTDRSREEKRWRDIATMIRPDDNSFDVRTDKDRDDALVFDSSPLLALDGFAGGMFTNATSPATRWFELADAVDADLSAWGPARDWLWTVTSILLSSLGPSRSSFYEEIPAVFADLGAFGLGTIAQQENLREARIADRAVPIGQSFIDVDSEGRVNRFHNQFRWTGDQVKDFFREKTPDKVKDAAQYVLVHAVGPNPDFDPTRIGYKYLPYTGCYLSADIPDLFIEGGFGELPYHPLLWNRRAGRAYPTGPGANARPDMNTLNEMERTNLVAGQFAAEPPLLVKQKSAVSAADIVPNAVIKGGVSDRGEQLVTLLERRQQLGSSTAQAEQKRRSIQQAFFFSLFQVMDRPEMTATEFLGWQSEQLRLLGPHLVHIQAGLSSFIGRRFKIFQRANALPPPPPEMEGRQIKVDYVSPLAKLQLVDEGRAVLQLHAAVEQMSLTDPTARDNFDVDIGVRAVARSLFTPAGVVRGPEAVSEMRKARAAESARQSGIAETAVVAETAATAAHAAQAATSATQRGKAA